MDEAMEHDVAVWQGFTRTEARRIRALLRLPEQAGLDGLEKALAYRMYARINRDEIIREGDDALVYRTLECYVPVSYTHLLYFNVFAALVQAFIFITLTLININEATTE